MSSSGPSDRDAGVNEGVAAQQWAPPTTPAVERLNDHLVQEAGALSSEPVARPTPGRVTVEEANAIFSRVAEIADAADVHAVELSHRQLGEIADEAGIRLESVAAVLAEGLVVSDDGWSLSDWLIGPSELSGVRSTARSEAELEEDLLVWLRSGHGLRPRMTGDGLIAAERRRGAVGALGRRVLASQDFGGLGEARGIRAAVVEAADDASAICLVVDVGDFRRSRSGAAIALGGTLTAGALALVTPFAVIGIPAAIGAGVAKTRSSYKSKVRTVENDLEETLDGVAAGESPPVINLETGRRILGGLRDARARRSAAKESKSGQKRGGRRR